MNTQHKQQLEMMLDALTTELQSLGVENPDVPGDWVTSSQGTSEADPNDVADRTEEYNERRATLAPLETRYRNIVRALKKIELGTYGICEVSGEVIEPERLAANPAARTCLAHLDEEVTLAD